METLSFSVLLVMLLLVVSVAALRSQEGGLDWGAIREEGGGTSGDGVNLVAGGLRW